MGKHKESTTTNSPSVDMGKLYMESWRYLWGEVYGRTFEQSMERHFWRRIRQDRKEKE